MGKEQGKFWNSDKLFGLTAMLISLVTLIIFVEQTNIMDKQSRLSAMPYLMIEQSTSSENKSIQFSLVNHGVGPAIIESRKIIYNNKEYDQDPHSFITQSVPELDSIEPYNWASIYSGQAIPANGRVVMIAIGNNPKEYEQFLNWITGLQKENSFYYEIIFQSVYGEKWKITNQQAIPERVE